jgi:hypothetical protein
MYQTYYKDQKWRQDIPKAGAGSGWFGRLRQTTPRQSQGIRRIHEKEGNN